MGPCRQLPLRMRNQAITRATQDKQAGARTGPRRSKGRAQGRGGIPAGGAMC